MKKSFCLLSKAQCYEYSVETMIWDFFFPFLLKQKTDLQQNCKFLFLFVFSIPFYIQHSISWLLKRKLFDLRMFQAEENLCKYSLRVNMEPCLSVLTTKYMVIICCPFYLKCLTTPSGLVLCKHFFLSSCHSCRSRKLQLSRKTCFFNYSSYPLLLKMLSLLSPVTSI